VWRIKKNAAGEVERFKARLVAQGFTQVPGVDYFDTFAPVAKLSSVRTVLALAARQDLEIHQVDIKSAYLNGVLEDNEVIYMRQAPSIQNNPGKVLHLKKSLYGLKQSGRRWYKKLYEVLKKLFSLAQCEVDHAVFFHRSGHETIIFVVHVDDLTIVTSGKVLMDEVKKKLRTELEVTDLGEIHWLLGIEIRRNCENQSIMLSQKSYIDSIIKRFGLEDAKLLASPMEPSAHLTNTQCPATSREIGDMRDVPYREAVGSLMYATIATRPDIAFAIGILSRFSTNPGRAHWEAVKRVFRYLKGTRELWLTFGNNTCDASHSHDFIGYADADGSMQEDRHAISGYAFLIDGGAVSWSSKRQEIIVLSTTEAEYVAATHAAKEALWLRTFVSEIFGPISNTTTLYSDNQSAIALSKDHQYHARTKHIDIRFHYIRWIIDEGKLKLVYCPTEDMVADTFTKPLPSAKAKHFACELGLRTA
jgi:Reverse transcriptase (RNA-dependent DNA polymerase)